MIKIQYSAKNDPAKLSAPYWQVGYLDPKNKFQFKPITPYMHYSKSNANELATLLNDAVRLHSEINELPEGDSDKLLSGNTIDPNDMMESQKSLDVLASWLSITERLHEAMKGSLIRKIMDIKDITVNFLDAAKNVDLQKDSQGNWKAYKKNC